MWRRLLLLTLVVVVAVEGVTMGEDDADGGIEKAPTITAESTIGDMTDDRLAALEDTVAALVDSLRQESSSWQVQQEGELMRRVEAVEGEVWRLEKRLESLEDDLGMLVFLDSRLRSTQEELRDLAQLLNRAQQDMEEVRRQVRQHDSTLTSLSNDVTQATKMTSQLHLDLQNHTLALADIETQCGDAESSIIDLHSSLHNLTTQVDALRAKSYQQPLLLCPAPYRKVGGSCLHLLESQGSWNWAREQCRALGVSVGGLGDLAVPSDLNLFRNYVEYSSSASPFLWVGGERTEGVWRWVTGAVMGEDVPWDFGEPDNLPGQRYVCLRSGGSVKFHDCTSTASLAGVCQVK